MKYKLVVLCILSILLAGCAGKREITIRFSDDVEMSGKKIALKDINPDLPTDWDGYNYVVLEYKTTTAQRFQLGFTTEWGYNELRIMSYVPGAWNRLSIPLKYFTQLPDAALHGLDKSWWKTRPYEGRGFCRSQNQETYRKS